VTLLEPPVTVIVILAGLGGDLVLGHPQPAHHVYLHQASDTLGNPGTSNPSSLLQSHHNLQRKAE